MMFINIITHRLKVILENVCGMFQTTAYTFGLHVRLPVSVVELKKECFSIYIFPLNEHIIYRNFLLKGPVVKEAECVLGNISFYQGNLISNMVGKQKTKTLITQKIQNMRL